METNEREEWEREPLGADLARQVAKGEKSLMPRDVLAEILSTNPNEPASHAAYLLLRAETQYEFRSLRSEVGMLSRQVARLYEKVLQLDERVSKLDERVSRLEDAVGGLAQQISKLDHSVEMIAQQLAKLLMRKE